MGDREDLLELIKSRAVLHGHFVLSSGRRSEYYIDARLVTLSAVGSAAIGRLLYQRLAAAPPDAVAGMSLGADPIVAAVMVTSAHAGRPIDGLLVRKTLKEYGTTKRVEGPVRPGMSAVIVEDTSTTGSSALEAVQALRDAGIQVHRIISMIDREEGAADAIQGAGLLFEPVFTVSEVLSHPKDKTSVRRTAVLQTDGAAQGNPGPAGAGYIVLDASGRELDRGSRFLGTQTNNVAEYEALILGLKAAAALGITELTVRMDSELVVKQMRGQYRVKHPNLQGLYVKASQATAPFTRVRFEYVPREGNSLADGLASKAAFDGPKGV